MLTSVSVEAQQFLGAGFGMAEESSTPALDDLDAWRDLIEASNAGVAATFEMRTAGEQPDVELRTVGDVAVYVVTPDDRDRRQLGTYLDINGGAFTMGMGTRAGR